MEPRMLPAALATVMLSLGLVLAPPAVAATEAHWEFSTRPADQPIPTVPARTLVEGSALHRQGHESSVAVEVELGAKPDGSTDAMLRIAFGELDDAKECAPVWEVSVSTYEPGPGATRDGARISVTRGLEPYAGGEWNCAFLALTEPSDPSIVHDRLDGAVGWTVVINRTAYVKITQVGHTRLARGEWSFVRIELTNRASDITRVRLEGEGRGLRVRAVVVEREMSRGDTVTLRLPVKIEPGKPRRLTITTYPRGHDIAFARRDTKHVRIEPLG